MKEHLPSTATASVLLSLETCFWLAGIYFSILIVRMVKREKKKKGQTMLCDVLDIYTKLFVVM